MVLQCRRCGNPLGPKSWRDAQLLPQLPRAWIPRRVSWGGVLTQAPPCGTFLDFPSCRLDRHRPKPARTVQPRELCGLVDQGQLVYLEAKEDRLRVFARFLCHSQRISVGKIPRQHPLTFGYPLDIVWSWTARTPPAPSALPARLLPAVGVRTNSATSATAARSVGRPSPTVRLSR